MTILNPYCVIQRGKAKSSRLAEAVIAGAEWGAIGYETAAADIPEGMTPVFIGVHPTTVQALKDVRAAERPFVAIDNGYFRPYQEGGYFRATSNAIQWVCEHPLGLHPGRAPVDGGAARWVALDMDIAPWQPAIGDKTVLVVLQSDAWMEMFAGGTAAWLDAATKAIAKQTRAKIVVRRKPLKGEPPQPPLDDQLAEAGCVVGFSSAVLLKALLAGIPVFPQSLCAASPLGRANLQFLATPKRPPREAVLHQLAANQWTIEEIASGQMWAAVRERYEPWFPQLS